MSVAVVMRVVAARRWWRGGDGSEEVCDGSRRTHTLGGGVRADVAVRVSWRAKSCGGVVTQATKVY